MHFKIQKPIVSSDGSDDCLIYNEDRTIEFMTPLENVQRSFEQGEDKIYVEGSLMDEDFIIVKKLPQQSW